MRHCNSYAHQLRNWWTNLAPLSVLQLTLKYTITDPNLQVSHILDDQSSCQPAIKQKKPPWFPTNLIRKPRGAWPTFVSFPIAQHQHWFNQLEVLAMQPHGTMTKYTCLSLTLYISFLMLGGRNYHVIWFKLFLIHLEVHLLEKQLQPSTKGQLYCEEPNTLGFSNTLSNSIPCVSNYPFVMGN
jgi:hypothetical protein